MSVLEEPYKKHPYWNKSFLKFEKNKAKGSITMAKNNNNTYWNKIDYSLLEENNLAGQVLGEQMQDAVVHDDELYELKLLITDLRYKKEAVDAHLLALQNTLNNIQEILDL